MTVTIRHLSPKLLVALAARVERLAPSHCNPHRFFEDRSDIAHELRELAREVRS